MAARVLAFITLWVALPAAAAAPPVPELPTCSSLAGWRSATGFRGWEAVQDPQEGTPCLSLDTGPEAVILSPRPLGLVHAEVSVRLRQGSDPWSFVRAYVGTSGDARTGITVTVWPGRGTVALARRRDARDGTPVTSPLPAGLARPGDRVFVLGYRLEDGQHTALLNGAPVASLDEPAGEISGLVGLAGSYVTAQFADLRLESRDARPLVTDPFQAIETWDRWYGPDAWEATDDPARPGNRVAVFEAQADGALSRHCPWPHFTAEIRGRFSEATNRWACFGLRTRLSKDRKSFYVTEVRPSQRRLVFWKSIDGAHDAAMAHDAPLPAVEAAEWMDLRVDVLGNRITVQVDGAPLLDITDPAPLQPGDIGISASYSTVHLDDFRLSRLDSDYLFAHTAADTSAYDPGAALPEVGDTEDGEIPYWFMESLKLRVAIHKGTGAIGGVWRQPGGHRLVERIVSLYGCETRADETRTSSLSDDVVSIEAHSRSLLDVTCANRELPGVLIRKRYSFARDHGGRLPALVQTLSFRNDGDRPDVFLTLASRAVLARGFHERAILTGGNYLGPLVKATSVRERVLTGPRKKPWMTGVTNGRPSWVLALTGPAAPGFASFRYRVNGQYTLPWNAVWTEPLHNLYHTPVGWEMGVCTLHLRPQESRSATLRHAAFLGGTAAFFGAYRELPDVRAVWDAVQPRPAWVADVKMPIRALTEAALALTDEGTMVRLTSPFGIWGDLPAEGAALAASGCAERPVEMIRDELQRARSLSPRVKVGVYTWAWSAHRVSRAVKEHPDWFIPNDKQGEERNAYPLAMSYLRCLAAPGCLDATIRAYERLVEFYDEDFQYLDNDGTAAQVIDWEHLRIDQDYHWQRLHEGVLGAVRKRGPDRATFFNNRAIPQGDISFVELAEHEIHNRDWRVPANEMLPVKILQKHDPGRAAILLYWRAANEPSYANYCVGLGITPWDSGVEHLGYTNAAFETRHLTVVDAGLTPDWQWDSATQTEAFALRQGAAAVVSYIGHHETASDETLAFDVRPLGLVPGRRAYVWQFELLDCRDAAGRLTESECRKTYEQYRWAEDLVVRGSCLGMVPALPERYERSCTAVPLGLRMLVVTHVPAAVWSVNGRRNHMWLPDVRGVSVRGTFEEAAREARLACTVEADRAELLVPVPEGHLLGPVVVDGRPERAEVEWIDSAWCARVGVPRGEHSLRVAFTPSGSCPAPRPSLLRAPSPVTPGAELLVSLGGDFGPVSGRRATLFAEREGILIASRTLTVPDAASCEARLPVPPAARPGTYDLGFAVEGAQPARRGLLGRIDVTEGDWQPAVRAGSENGQPQTRIWTVGTSVNGLHVLRAATDTWDHRGGTQEAEWDLGTATARCGIRGLADTHWGYGFCGLEITGAEGLKVDTTNTISKAYQEGYELGARYLDSFVGFMIDYRTEAGYSKRVALSLGVLNERRPVHAPNWGKAGRPDRVVSFSKTVLERPSESIMVDLRRHAPPDWDGTVWFAIGVDTVRRGHRLEARVHAAEAGTDVGGE